MGINISEQQLPMEYHATAPLFFILIRPCGVYTIHQDRQARKHVVRLRRTTTCPDIMLYGLRSASKEKWRMDNAQTLPGWLANLYYSPELCHILYFRPIKRPVHVVWGNLLYKLGKQYIHA